MIEYRVKIDDKNYLKYIHIQTLSYIYLTNIIMTSCTFQKIRYAMNSFSLLIPDSFMHFCVALRS